MKLVMALLALTFALAAGAMVLAVWPVVGDAPWEESNSEAAGEEEGRDDIRCEAALSLRETIISEGRYHTSRNPDGLRDYEAQLGRAGREILDYC
jgi:hypothetical protein